MKILIRATNWLGDAVMSIPAIRAVRDNFRKSEITVLAKRSVADLYARESSIDRIIPYDGHRFKTAQSLRARKFDLGILFTNSFDSALVFRLAGIPRIIGYKRDMRGFLLTDSVRFPFHREVTVHERFNYLELLQNARLIDAYHSGDGPIHLECAAEARVEGFKYFAANGVTAPVVGVSPGAAYGGSKRWFPDRFAESASHLAAQIGGTVAIFGAPDDLDTCAGVEKLIQGVPVVNLAGRTSLRQFIDLAAACSLYVTNDSGSMHVASALGVPTVAIFGATNPVTTGPIGKPSVVIRNKVPCSPCRHRECPVSEPVEHPCMSGVTSEQVIAAGLKLIQVQGRS